MQGLPTSEGSLLGGRVRYAQPLAGHRTGIEPVLLAAAVPARPGERVLEGGTGAGAGLLCLAARVPGLLGVGLERMAELADVAETNLAANGFADCAIRLADIVDSAAFGPFQHAFANPPWHDPAGTASPDTLRDVAKRAAIGLPLVWTKALAAALRPRGTLTLILPAAGLPAWLAAQSAAGCGSIKLFPLWSRIGQPAKLLIMQSVRGGGGPCRVLAGLVLHDGTGYTTEAELILRAGQPLRWEGGAG